MEEIEDIIRVILNGYPCHRWDGNIIDLVFVAIEQSPAHLKRYHEFADGDYGTTNQMIGRFIKAYTGMKTGKVIDNHHSGLIKTYSELM